MEKYKSYINIINNVLDKKVKEIKLVTDTSNVVFKVIQKEEEVLYVKFYLNKSSHIDHEMELYNIVDNKYLKEIVYYSNDPKFTIFKEVQGKTIDQLSEKELEYHKDKIVDSLIDFFETIKNRKIDGYGLINQNLQGQYNNFKDFIIKRQTDTQNELQAYPLLKNLFSKIYNKYEDIIEADNSIVPIDTNMKNIIITQNNEIKFIDPGEIISGPILMAYGDVVAHTYKTSLYNCLIKKLNLSKVDEKKMRIYAIFSSLNILAFLSKAGVTNLNTVIPYGNRYTFFDLMISHMDNLEINIK